MSDSLRAIFLSYAREDAAAARRIAEALRASGLEVWFDENELRGGDTWDAKIRKQIDECALFVPIISAHTQERSKGYFRLEWKLAVDQTHLLAAGVPFVAPVVVDATKENEAVVPPEFMRVHWTRLPDGLPTPGFVDQIRRLLDRKSGTGAPEGTRSPMSHPGLATSAPAKKLPGWLIPTAVGLVVAAGVFLLMRKPGPSDTNSTASATAPKTENREPKTAAAPPARVADKSIAILPFTNMSDDKESGFFADGVHEDVLTNLALIRELRVVSRTSVLPYRSSGKSMRQIAQELGVTYILEGSVRRSGNKVRVTGQLIHAASDEHVWAQTYDRDLTDIFGIQTELSQQIAGALKAALSPEEKVFIARKPTDNPAAYDAYLQGRDTRNRAPTASRAALNDAENFFGRAVELDPNFAAAWGELAVVHALKTFWDIDASAERMAKVDAAIARALQLAPDAPEVIRLDGTAAYYAHRDYARATAQYRRILALQPNDPTAYASLGLIQRRQGRWAEALASLRRACELDPANITYLRNLRSTAAYVRAWPEARQGLERLVALLPGRKIEEFFGAYGYFQSAGTTAPFEAVLNSLSAGEKDSPMGIYARKQLALLRDDHVEFKRLDALQPYYADLELSTLAAADAAILYFAHGDRAATVARATATLDEARAQLAREPGNLRVRLTVGVMHAVLGNKEDALREVRAVVDVLPVSRDALDGPACLYFLAQVQALTGDKEQALATLDQVLRVPGQYTVHTIRADQAMFSLRDDPRFEALLNDPKNNAPLF